MHKGTNSKNNNWNERKKKEKLNLQLSENTYNLENFSYKKHF